MNLNIEGFGDEFALPGVSLYDLFHVGIVEPSGVVGFNEVDGQYNGIKEVQSIRFVRIYLSSVEEARK